jgi:hypothetical protein
MNNSKTLGLNEFGMESKMLRDIDMYISFSDDSNCIIMPAIIEYYTNEKITGMFVWKPRHSIGLGQLEVGNWLLQSMWLSLFAFAICLYNIGISS